MNKTYQIFISHSSKDAWTSKQIENHIRQIGCKTFLDDGNIDVGDDFEKIILKEIRNSKEFLVLFTPAAKERKYIWSELGAAWILKLRIVVVLYGISQEEVLIDGSNPAYLKNKQWIELNDIDKFFHQLKNRVHKDVIK